LKTPQGVNARRFVAALQEDGFHLARTEGSHRRYKHPDGRAVTVAYHRLSDTFTIKTLSRMLRATRWTEDDLRRHGFLD
jgi:predicted RNA binding protein YcfA (HicA-like mRNA interferase family)